MRTGKLLAQNSDKVRVSADSGQLCEIGKMEGRRKGRGKEGVMIDP